MIIDSIISVVSYMTELSRYKSDYICHARIQEFSSGGVQVSLTKKGLTTFFFFFFSPQLILQKSNGQFQRNLSFFKVPEGVQYFPGGRGVQLLIPYRNPYNL